MKDFRSKFLRGFVIVFGALILAGGGYYLLRYQIWAGYRSWSVGRMNTMARDFITAGDSRNAMLIVRKILSSRPNDVGALALAVKAAEMSSSSDAILYQRNLCRVQKTTANNIELMRLALKHEAYSYGLEAITAVAQDARSIPEYHRLAAEIYRQVRRPLPAKYQLISLLSLSPGDNPAKIALAEIEFEAAPGNLPSDWKARVDNLTRVPEVALAATLLQLRAAVNRQDAAEAAALVAKLQSHPDMTLAQRLRVLEANWLYNPATADSFLADLQKEAIARPADVVQVMEFLATHSKHEAARDWYARLPETLRQIEPVKMVTAQSLEVLNDWTGIETVLRGAAWKVNEHQRLALLAHAYRLTGRFADSAQSWKLAMISAGQDPRKITALLRNVENWKWDNERYDLLWRLFNLMPTNTAVQKFLVAREFHDGKTANLNKIYARLVEANPNDDTARNNFAYTSLLLDTNPGRAQTIARELFKKHPENVSYRTTYTLALHKQGQDKEALELIRQLDAATRLAPVPKLHEAVYAASTGQIEQAEALLTDLASAELLPEQRQLAGTVNLALARHQKTQGRQNQFESGEQGPANEGLLALLPKRGQETPSSWKVADSYLRQKNFSALRQFLKDEKWDQDEYLRYAIIAFAERMESPDDRFRSSWRQALGAAGRDGAKLHELEVLTEKWSWTDERMEVSGRIFERESANSSRLAELLDYYRRNSRTSDMARVLWLYVDQTNATGVEAAWCVYYSLLCGTNVSPAQTLALRVYDKAPQNPRHRVAYAFALLRQQRFAEALKLVEDIDAPDLTGMQVSLVEASALLELGRKDEARNILKKFTAVNAIPEEINFAATLFRQAGLPSAVNAFTLQ
jgi:cellulose synthase operon protein C